MKKTSLCCLLAAAVLLAGCGPRQTQIAIAATPVPTAAATPEPTPTASPTPQPAVPPEPGEPIQAQTPAERYAGVALAPHVEPEMLEPDYWLQGDAAADELLLDAEQIAVFNLAIVQTLAPESRMYDVMTLAQQQSVPGTQVDAWLAADPALPVGDTVNGQPMLAGYLTALEQNRNRAALAETVPLRYGVTVDRVNVRVQPTDDFVAGGKNKFIDAAQQAELYWNEPVLVLHESADAAWYYIVHDRMTGWVPETAVALFGDYESWLAWQQPQDFLVVTANHMRLDCNHAEPELSYRELSMGTVLPLAAPEETPRSLAGRTALGNYIVKLPLRGAGGEIKPTLAPVPVSTDVSRGYLPYTRRNVLRQLFKFQGSNYGWGGTQGSNDCSGITSQTYRCFGLELPRNSKSLSMLPCTTVDLAGLDTAARGAALGQVPVGSILYFPGHIMLYLGERDGHYYVMSSLGSVDLNGKGKTEPIWTVLINDLDVRRPDGVSWLNQMARAKVLENGQTK